MIWHTHYFRKDIHEWATPTSPQESLVLSAIPTGELLTINTILGNLLNNKDNDLIRSTREVRTYLDNLIKLGFVGEANFERVYKFVKSLR